MLTSDESDVDDGKNLNDSFPSLQMGDEDSWEREKDDRMDTDYLLDAEFSDQHRADQLAQIAKEINLFELEDDTGPVNPVQVSVPDVKQRQIKLSPPGVPFFTSHPYQFYTEDTLVWPFTDASTNPLADLPPEKVRRYIKEGLFQRVYSSSVTARLMMKYLFHLCCCTKDEELLYPTYNTLCYIAENNDSHMNICQELYLALANFGGDVKKHGKDPSVMKSSVLPDSPGQSETEEPFVVTKNLTLMLQFLGVLLSHSKKCTEDDLDELLKMFIVIGLDDELINNGLDPQISTCISRTLDLYPSKNAFYGRVQGLVEKIVTYCDFHHHTVSHVCTMYIMPTSLGQILLKSVAFLQVELALQAEDKNILDIVEVDDIVELIEKQLEVINKEEDGYLLHSVMRLLVCCVGDGPFTPAQKRCLRHIYSLLDPIIATKRPKVEDMYSSLFRCYSRSVIDKWRSLSGLTGRQQTLHEMQLNSSQEREDHVVMKSPDNRSQIEESSEEIMEGSRIQNKEVIANDVS